MLAVYSQARNSIELVKIRVCFRYPDKLEVATPGYHVEHLRGAGITHFAFGVRDILGEELILLDACHWMNESESAECYFPYSDTFLRDEFIQEGTRFLLGNIRAAQEELRANAVMSRAFPKEPLHTIVPDELLMNLALIEQMDNDEFKDRCPFVRDLPEENRVYENCAEYAVFKVLVHLALNRERAFSFVPSRTHAMGLMQFMRRSYYMVRREYPKADLISDHIAGTRNMRNSIKAAICLLDYYLAELAPTARSGFAINHRLFGIFPVAAYNGGPRKARRLYKALSLGEVDPSNFRAPKRTVHPETGGYINKFLNTWPVIDQLKAKNGSLL